MNCDTIAVSGGNAESQPTRCGHMLARCPLPGLAGGACGRVPPRPPERQKADRVMTATREKRSAWIKIRVTPAEKKRIADMASAQGQTVTDFLRQRALDYRLRQSPLEKERVRQLARIGANLNQVARWANTWKGKEQTVEVVLALAGIEKELHLLRSSVPSGAGEGAC